MGAPSSRLPAQRSSPAARKVVKVQDEASVRGGPLCGSVAKLCGLPKLALILAEVEVRDLAVRRLEDFLDLGRGAQEIGVDAYPGRIELRHEIHEKPAAAVQAAVIANVVDQPKNIGWSGHQPVFPQGDNMIICIVVRSKMRRYAERA